MGMRKMASTMHLLGKLALPCAAAFGLLAAPVAATAQPRSLALLDSIPIGSNGLCEAQIQSPRPDDGLFDRTYIVICRDTAAAVGSLAVFDRTTSEAAVRRLIGAEATCRDSGTVQLAGGLSSGRAQVCALPGNPIERLVLAGERGGRVYAASGLAVYGDALRLGLASLAADRVVEGEVQVPLTLASDPQAFARAQAEAISAEIALDEAYRRSNAGNFAEAAAFFSASVDNLSGASATEALLNAGLQQSNLGNFAEAARLFAEAEGAAQVDPVLARLLRNFRTIDALNRLDPAEALRVLDTPLQALSDSIDATLQLQIDRAMASRLAAEQANAVSGGTAPLTLAERLQLLDAQATYLRGSALRLSGKGAESEALMTRADSEIAAVREGRVGSMLWLRAQIAAERALLAEERSANAEAEALNLAAVRMLEVAHPGSPALTAARAALAGFYARTGRETEATAIFRQLVQEAGDASALSLRRQLSPYFALLARSGSQSAPADMFAASQLMVRPGLAQTQAVLARELSAGSDEAAQLFRQSINLGRAIEIRRLELAQAELGAIDDPALAARLATMREELVALGERQLEVLQQLAAYPRYRAVSDTRMELADLQRVLGPQEAYLKLVMLGDAAYAIYAQADTARAYRLAASPAQIGRMVDTLRDSIAVEEGGQTITYPFEMATARQLYEILMGPVSHDLVRIRHLVFEPDGALLRLPINLLVMDDASVERYTARTAEPAGDPYDYRGTAWLGRAMHVTTAVSPSSFRDVRNARRSSARSEYLGLGQNLPVTPAQARSGSTRSGISAGRCEWSPLTWSSPIKADELRRASRILSAGGAGVAVLTEGDFTDTRLKGMPDLNQYRILHFATHGLVTSPQPDCPPRPALLTSFGDEGSDGLLTFAEIFDLRLDADLVILSACNTASVGGLAASREAGVTTGGDFALDGLVRAFVGAGGRTVIASHWPVPDDFDATGRLIGGFFEAGSGQSIGEALRLAQLGLMDDADTSHPFYWAAFAVVGDGAIGLRR